ncbi:MAG: hypothetical protein EOP04_03340 [Proteobacteria bacterium]|nr:MAG: hypothetical protein EOP04_03340 [Pseudomonadota bacterium]
MKKVILSLATLLVSTLSFAQPSQSLEEKTVSFSCSSEPVGKNQYAYTLEIQGDRLEISQTANNARYAPLEFSLVEAGNEVPEQKVLFSCVNLDPSDIDGYQYTIEVYKNKAAVLQQSTLGRYMAIVWNLSPIKN